MSDTKDKKKEKCFVIMPISDQGDYPVGHFTKVYEQIIKPSIEDAGYEAYRVDENNICDPIINKIFSAIQDCPMAVCDLSNSNPNVLYELGLRQAYDKPVVLIQDDKTKKIFDVSGISTVFYKSTRLYEDVIEARENITKAIQVTKEGKVSSLAKVMKVSAADFSQIEVSQDDRMNVMLEGIYNEIRELKKDKDKNDGSCSVMRGSSWNSLYDQMNLSKMDGMFYGINDETYKKFSVELMKNLYGLLRINIKSRTEDGWMLEFIFNNHEVIKSAPSVIREIASKYNIDFMNQNITLVIKDD